MKILNQQQPRPAAMRTGGGEAKALSVADQVAQDLAAVELFLNLAERSLDNDDPRTSLALIDDVRCELRALEALLAKRKLNAGGKLDGAWSVLAERHQQLTRRSGEDFRDALALMDPGAR